MRGTLGITNANVFWRGLLTCEYHEFLHNLVAPYATYPETECRRYSC